MSYIALYRKYRPQNFEEIVGQDAIVTTLKNQIENNKIAHAYLFCGMRGTGKTSTARIFAKALNCEKGPTIHPCNKCTSCRAINNGSMVDVIEMDAASNRGIDDIRDLREKVDFPPSEGRYKVYIIDEVHMLTTEAFNALLKTLEEPPRHVVFILATTEPNKLPLTILSRCMRFDFKRVATHKLVARMQEIAGDLGIDVEERALAQIAKSSQGSVRDALSLLDKALAFGGKKLSFDDTLNLLGAVSNEVLYEVSRAVAKEDRSSILDTVDETVSQGKDIFKFADELLEHYRNILMVSIGAQRHLVDVIDEEYLELKKLAKSYTREKLLSILDILKDAVNDMKWSSRPRIVLEAALVKLTLPDLWEGAQEYASRLQEVEREIEDLKQGLKRLDKAIASGKVVLSGENSGKFCGTISEDHENESNAGGMENVPANFEKAPDENMALQAIGSKENDGDDKCEKDLKDDNTEILKELKGAWPAIIEGLEKNGKKTLQTFIRTDNVEPYRLEDNKLYLSYSGNDFCKEIILSEKHIIEDMVKDITGKEIFIKGFERPKAADEKKKLEESSGDVDGEKDGERAEKETPANFDGDISDEEFYENVIKIFGKDIVEVKKG